MSTVLDTPRAAEPPTMSVRRHGGRSGRHVLVAASILSAALGFAAWHVPTPRYVERAGSVLDLVARVTVAGGVPVTPIDGSYDGLTVIHAQLDLGPLLLLHEIRPTECTVDGTYRFEGPSDPADECVIFALTLPCGHRGTLVSAYGPEASSDEADAIRQLGHPGRT